MQSLLAEQPLILSLILAVLVLGLIYSWLQTGKKEIAVAALVIAALIPVVWVIANHWVTDREQIETLIYRTADAIENNDHERALDLIADETIRERARRELGTFVFDETKVTRIREIKLIDGTFPQEADVDMNVKIIVSEKSGPMQNVTVPRRLMLRLQKDGDRWMITDYRHTSVVGKPDKQDSRQIR